MEKSLNYHARRELLQQTASQYREASPSQKRTLLDAFIATTGYVRKYARWLLNHAKEAQQTLQRPRPRRYGPEVQHALFLVWHAANRICTKRLIPFLPTFIEALERHEHLHLTDECRRQLLSMSAATADRLLRSSANKASVASRRREPEPCSSSRSRSAPSRSGRRPDLASWKRTWWPIVAPTSRAATCTP